MKGNSEVQKQKIESLYRQFTPPDSSTYGKTVYSSFQFPTWQSCWLWNLINGFKCTSLLVCDLLNSKWKLVLKKPQHVGT